MAKVNREEWFKAPFARLTSTHKVRRVSGNQVRNLLRRSGIDVVRYPEHHVAHKRVLLLNHYGIDLVFDVGANDGGYGSELRRFGYDGRVVSFEPLAMPYARLQELARADGKWTVVNVALGDARARAEINVAVNSTSSSFLPMQAAHRTAAPWATYAGTEQVSVICLDDIFRTHYKGSRSLLKIDVQGYEEHVLRGAARSLPLIQGVQLEMSLVPLYEGTWGFLDAVEYFGAEGFDLVSLEPGFYDRATGRLLQVDGIFMRARNSS